MPNGFDLLINSNYSKNELYHQGLRNIFHITREIE